MGYIRKNKATGELNTKMLVPNLEIASKKKLEEGWEWVNVKDYKEQIQTLNEAKLRAKYSENRAKEYEKQGLTADKMIIALWEKVVENRPESADTIQAKRTEIKAKYPKPV